MSKKRQGKTDSLVMAKSFRDLLLYEISGGNMGKKPEHDIKSETTFSEKSAFLDKMIKIAALEHKGKDDEEEASGFDLIREQINAGRKNKRGGDFGGGAAEGATFKSSIPDEPEPESSDGDEDGGEEEE